MPPINRNALFLAGRPPFFEWVNQLSPDLHVETNRDPLEHDNGTIYLTPEFYSTPDAMEWLEQNHLYFFELELWKWYTDEERWPSDRSWSRFQDWFYISFISMVENTVDLPFVEDPE